MKKKEKKKEEENKNKMINITKDTKKEQGKEKSSYVKRLVPGIIYLIIIIVLILVDNNKIASLFIGFVSLASVYEYFKCVNLKNTPFFFLAILTSLIVSISMLIYEAKMFVILPALLITIFLINFIIGILGKKKYDLSEIAIASLGYIYTIFLITYLAKIYFSTDGNIKVFYLFTVVIATDTFAYLTGKFFGKTKLTEISPKKTLEGSIGGAVFTTILSFIFAMILRMNGFNISYVSMVAAGMFLSIISQIGDLVASYIKRSYNKKDYGTLMGGHGGVLDRIDSLIFTLPFAYIMLSLMI